MNTDLTSKAWRFSPGRLTLAAFLLAALLAGMLSPLSFAPLAQAAGQAGQLAGAQQTTTVPGFVYQTVYSGAQFDSGHAEVVDGAGNAYILARAYDTSNDVMVVKLSPSGAVLFVAYLRGSLNDWGTGLALDGQGGLLVSGWTDSPDFPVLNAAQPVKDNNRSGFLARLSTADGTLLYSSFFGGNRADEFHDVAVNASGEIYLVGKTDSTDFPTLNPLQAGLNLTNCFCDDAFVLRLSADARTILYSTYLGGGLDDQADSLGLDAAGNIYVAGITKSDDFPTANPLQANRSGDSDVWAARISADGSHLDYSTYLGGTNTEYLGRLVVDPSGFATLAGTTNSAAFPTTLGAFQPAFGGGLCGAAGFGQRSCYDAFVTRLAPDGSSLVYSTYLGGNSDDEARGVAVDSAGNAYLVGYTSSPNFPPSGISSSFEIFVSSLDPSGSQLRYSVTEFSATANDGHGIALGPGDDIFFTGAKNAPSDLYAARLSESSGPLPTPTPTPTPPPPSTTLHVGDLDGSASGSRTWKASVSVLVHDAGHQPLANVTVRGAWSNGATGSSQCVTGSDGTCTLTKSSLSRFVSSVTFTVSNLSKSGYSYTSSINHDPDGDSNGTSILVSRP
jgi:Beta-propeller repeat